MNSKALMTDLNNQLSQAVPACIIPALVDLKTRKFNELKNNTEKKLSIKQQIKCDEVIEKLRALLEMQKAGTLSGYLCRLLSH